MDTKFTHKVAFLYTTGKRTKREIRETVLFAILSINIKYFGATLIKQIKDLYDKNFNFLKTGIQKDSRR